METTIEQALELAVKAHRAGELTGASRLYRSILAIDPANAEAHHNLGAIALDSGKPYEALSYLRAALDADQTKEVFWVSYIDALITVKRPSEATQLLEVGESLGLSGDLVRERKKGTDQLSAVLVESAAEPTVAEMDDLLSAFNANDHEGAEQKAIAFADKYPNHSFGWKALGIVFQETGRFKESVEPLRRCRLMDVTDPETENSLGNALAALQEFEEAEQCYRAAISIDGSFADAHHNLGNLLVRIGRLTEAEESYRTAIRLRPDFVDGLVCLGDLLVKLQRPADAESIYRSVIQLRPNYPEVLASLGSILSTLGQNEEAAEKLRNAISLKPDMPVAHCNLGAVLKKMRLHEQAKRCYLEAIRLKPDLAEAHNNLGAVLNKLSEVQEAERSLLEAIRLKSDYADAQWNLSLNQLLQSRLENGFRLYEWRWNAGTCLKGLERHFKQPLWLGAENLTGKTILVHAEQGLGDTLQFCRYIKLLKSLGPKVIFEVQKPLAKLLADLDGVDVLVAKGERLPSFDFHCPLLSLPLALKTKEDSVPATGKYISVPSERQARWSEALGKAGFKIGICWKSGETNEARSIPLELFHPIAKIDGVRLISLHKGKGESELANVPSEMKVETLGPDFDATGAFLDTAAVIACCDLVITVDTSVAHLAGALSAETLIALPFEPDWRWMVRRSDSPWYPSVTLFRQLSVGDWGDVIAGIAAEVRKKIFARGRHV